MCIRLRVLLCSITAYDHTWHATAPYRICMHMHAHVTLLLALTTPHVLFTKAMYVFTAAMLIIIAATPAHPADILTVAISEFHAWTVHGVVHLVSVATCLCLRELTRGSDILCGVLPG